MASTIFTYILWMFGSNCGLHHFYLGRDLHAYLLMSLGPLVPIFFVAWARDMFRIPDYVLDFNEETGARLSGASGGSARELGGAGFMQRLQLEKDQYKDAPPRAWSRILAQLFFGSYFGVITKNVTSGHPARLVA